MNASRQRFLAPGSPHHLIGFWTWLLSRGCRHDLAFNVSVHGSIYDLAVKGLMTNPALLAINFVFTGLGPPSCVFELFVFERTMYYALPMGFTPPLSTDKYVYLALP